MSKNKTLLRFHTIAPFLLIVLFVAFCSKALADVTIDETTFPDEHFRKFVTDFDKNKDGTLSDKEIKNVTKINCDSHEIKDLKGIEHFTNITILSCSYNDLFTLDLKKNTNLEYLYCYNNHLTEMDLSNNHKLLHFYCSENQLISINVKNCTELLTLICDYNRLEKLELGKNYKLEIIGCYYNQLKSLDLSNAPNLKWVFCHHNQISKLNTSQNKALEEIYCSSNELSKLDISNNTSLKYLYCHFNNLTSLNVSNSQVLTNTVKNNQRKTFEGYDYFGLDEVGQEILIVDRTVEVKAGSFISKPTIEPPPTSATIKGLNYTLDNKAKTATFTGAESKTIKKLSIPSAIKVKGSTYKVTSIKASACKGYAKLTSLTLGKNIINIGKSAFNGCKKLTTITINTTKLTLETVGQYAFKNTGKKAIVKCPKSKIEDYKVILIKRGLSKQAQFK